MSQLSEDLRFRGLVHQVTDEGLLGRLDNGPMTVYAGFDPTAPSLHVGNLLQLCTLRRLQLAGHRPIVLAGGGTGLIGDPGGKSGERPLLSTEELARNLAGVRPQLAQFVDFTDLGGSARGLLLDNVEWLAAMPLVDFLRDVGKNFTVNQMVAKESVRARIERPEQGISFTEFSYMLLQAYDFLRLHEDYGCDVQLGGSDQWGNITLGVELVRKVARAEVFGLTTPLVTKTDGTKFGKTESGTIWLDSKRTSPYRLYQFFFNTEDVLVGQYLRYFSFLGPDEILTLDAETAEHPERREAQRALARQVTSLVHGGDEVERAERAAAALFTEEISSLDEQTLLEVFEDAPSSTVQSSDLRGDGLALVDVLVSATLVTSKSEARRAIKQGGIYVNNHKAQDENRTITPADLLFGRYSLLRRGRRDYHVLRVE